MINLKKLGLSFILATTFLTASVGVQAMDDADPAHVSKKTPAAIRVAPAPLQEGEEENPNSKFALQFEVSMDGIHFSLWSPEDSIKTIESWKKAVGVASLIEVKRDENTVFCFQTVDEQSSLMNAEDANLALQSLLIAEQEAQKAAVLLSHQPELNTASSAVVPQLQEQPQIGQEEEDVTLAKHIAQEKAERAAHAQRQAQAIEDLRAQIAAQQALLEQQAAELKRQQEIAEQQAAIAKIEVAPIITPPAPAPQPQSKINISYAEYLTLQNAGYTHLSVEPGTEVEYFRSKWGKADKKISKSQYDAREKKGKGRNKKSKTVQYYYKFV